MKNNELEVSPSDKQTMAGNCSYRHAEKSPHIVFQVMNFISGDSPLNEELNPSDRILLLMLAKHQGKKGLYPSVPTLAKEIKVTPRHVLRCLDRLECLKIIQVERKSGRSNHYK